MLRSMLPAVGDYWGQFATAWHAHENVNPGDYAGDLYAGGKAVVKRTVGRTAFVGPALGDTTRCAQTSRLTERDV